MQIRNVLPPWLLESCVLSTYHTVAYSRTLYVKCEWAWTASLKYYNYLNIPLNIISNNLLHMESWIPSLRHSKRWCGPKKTRVKIGEIGNSTAQYLVTSRDVPELWPGERLHEGRLDASLPDEREAADVGQSVGEESVVTVEDPLEELVLSGDGRDVHRDRGAYSGKRGNRVPTAGNGVTGCRGGTGGCHGGTGAMIGERGLSRGNVGCDGGTAAVMGERGLWRGNIE